MNIEIHCTGVDHIEVRGPYGIGEFDARAPWAVDLCAPDGDQVRVHMEHGLGWSIGFSDVDDATPMPNPTWPVESGPHPENEDGVLAVIEAPAGTRLVGWFTGGTSR